MFFVVCLCLVVQPAMAQREAWENLVKQTIGLESEISKVIKDTLLLHKKIAETAACTADIEKEINSVGRQIDVAADSISQPRLAMLQCETDSLAAAADSLTARKRVLAALKAKRSKELAGFERELSRMSVYAQIKREHSYARNRAIMRKRYSLVSLDELNDIEATMNNFSQMEDFDEYRQRVKAALTNKQLYDRAVTALNSSFDGSDISDIREEFIVLFGIENDNLQKGEFRLSEEQYSEIDSLDIKLSRYQVGIEELGSIIEKINTDVAIVEYRASRNKSQCLEAMKAILFSRDEEAMYIRERYFYMVPYLNCLLQQYWSELQVSPFDTPTPTENNIRQMIGR